MKLWRWDKGRQNSGYAKFTLAYSKRFKFDAYIIKIPRGTGVPIHVDPSVPGAEHHRVNITLWAPVYGGDTMAFDETDALKLMPRCYHFRPDIQEHLVTTAIGGNLWILSFGWLKDVSQG